MISVIIPTRNRFSYVTLLINDLLDQDLDLDYEIIAVDQSDNPEHLENCKHIITETRGPSVSRHGGFSRCSHPCSPPSRRRRGYPDERA